MAKAEYSEYLSRLNPDQAAFAGDDLGGVVAEIGDAEAEFAGLSEGAEAVGGFDERLARHAAPEDAKAANLFPAIEHDGLESQRSGGACGGVARAAPADHGKVVVAHASYLTHSWEKGKGEFGAVPLRFFGEKEKLIQRAVFGRLALGLEFRMALYRMP